MGKPMALSLHATEGIHEIETLTRLLQLDARRADFFDVALSSLRHRRQLHPPCNAAPDLALLFPWLCTALL